MDIQNFNSKSIVNTSNGFVEKFASKSNFRVSTREMNALTISSVKNFQYRMPKLY